MKRFNILILVTLTLVLVIGLVGCMALSAREITLSEVKTSLKDDYGIDIAEIKDESSEQSPVYSSVHANFDEMDGDLADAITERLEKWRYFQGRYYVMYLKTTEGEYKAVYFVYFALKHIGEGSNKVYGQVKDYLYITDTDFRW